MHRSMALLGAGTLLMLWASSVRGSGPATPLVPDHGRASRALAPAAPPGSGVRPVLADRASAPFDDVPLRTTGRDGLWWDGFALPELDGWVNDVAWFDGALVIGGRFTQVGGTFARNVARWDGIRWTPIGDGFDGDVLSLAIYRGDLVASGWFDHSGAQALRGIARWDGVAWSALGEGLWADMISPSIGATALEVSGDALYAGGGFDRAGGGAVRHLARWDGSAWSDVGGGVGAEVRSLLGSGDSLYVGGPFTEAGGIAARSIALWDGRQWHDLAGGISAATDPPRIEDLASFRGSLVVAGDFDSAGGAPSAGLAAWDGSGWTDLAGDRFPLGAYALLAEGDSLLAAHSSGIAAWNGSEWHDTSAWVSGWVGDLLETPLGLAIGGSYMAYGETSRPVVANIGLRREGAWVDPFSWTDRMGGLARWGVADVSALGLFRGRLVASGNFEYTGSAQGRVPVTSTVQWNGTTWEPLGDWLPGSARCLLTLRDTLYAGGIFYGPRGLSPVAVCDGQRWSLLDTLSLDASALVVHAGRVHACGFPISYDRPRTAGVYRWDGEGWTVVGLAGPAPEMGAATSMVEHQGRLVVAGWFREMGGVPARGFAAWDGTSWSAMDAGIGSANPTALGTWEGGLYAGGVLRDTEGRYASLVRWEGSRWSAVPSPWMAPLALVSDGRGLLAGGWVFGPDQAQHGILRWDGRDWSMLGSGTNDAVRSLVVQDGFLYLGGRFTQAGGHSSFGVARWDLEAETVERLAGSGTCAPNPFTLSTSVAFSLAAPARVRVAVFDLRGRRIATLEDGERPAGAHSLAWDGRERDGSVAAPGVYFVRLDLGGRLESRRVVRLR